MKAEQKPGLRPSAKELTREEIQISDQLELSDKQLNYLLGATPRKYIQTRPAKGGGTWDYVSIGYINKVLNLMFGWNWDFQIISKEYDLEIGQCVVQGRLTCRTATSTIIKEQFGEQDIKFRKDNKKPLNLGNDLKGAASDSLKKCASLIGIAGDVYYKDEFQAVKVTPPRNTKADQFKRYLSECTDHQEVDFIIQNYQDAYGDLPQALQELATKKELELQSR